jgi:hypothetical protein
MGMSVEYLLSPYIGEVTRAVHSNPKPDDLADEVVKHEERNLPVHETLENTDRLYPDTMLMVTEPIQWLRRPDPLIGVPRSFGCYVNDDRSSPVFERGDLIFVHPYRPPRVGDDCLFCSGGMWDFRTDLEAPVDEKVVRIGRLMGRTKSTWTVRQFNPDDEFFLDAEDWGAWLIVGKYSRA